MDLFAKVPTESISLFHISLNQLQSNQSLLDLVQIVIEYNKMLPEHYNIHLNIMDLGKKINGYHCRTEVNVVSQRYKGFMNMFSIVHGSEFCFPLEVELGREVTFCRDEDDLQEVLDEMFSSGLPIKICEAILRIAPH